MLIVDRRTGRQKIGWMEWLNEWCYNNLLLSHLLKSIIRYPGRIILLKYTSDQTSHCINPSSALLCVQDNIPPSKQRLWSPAVSGSYLICQLPLLPILWFSAFPPVSALSQGGDGGVENCSRQIKACMSLKALRPHVEDFLSNTMLMGWYVCLMDSTQMSKSQSFLYLCHQRHRICELHPANKHNQIRLLTLGRVLWLAREARSCSQA